MTSRLALLVLLFAGCQAERPAPPAPPPSVTVAEAPADTAGAPVPAFAVALDGEGLRLVDVATGSTRPLAFGAARETVVTALSRVLGEVQEASVHTECGAGPLEHVTWGGALTVLLADGVFVGWSLNGPPDAARPYTTMAGLGLGSTRADLDAAYSASVDETTLGTEFAAGGVYGILSGPGADGRVEALWGGTSCNVR